MLANVGAMLTAALMVAIYLVLRNDKGAGKGPRMPDALRGKYQCFTQADQSRLRAAGYTAPFLTVQEGVARYCRWMMTQGN